LLVVVLPEDVGVHSIGPFLVSLDPSLALMRGSHGLKYSGAALVTVLRPLSMTAVSHDPVALLATFGVSMCLDVVCGDSELPGQHISLLWAGFSGNRFSKDNLVAVFDPGIPRSSFEPG
jgi:hypothetical protein